MLDGEALIEYLLDSKNVLNLDGLLDAVVALHVDCNYPVVKRIPAVESFLNKYDDVITHLSKHRLKCADFDLVKVIGKGAFGEVQLVRHRASQQVYAMKLLDKQEMVRRSDSAFFWEEREIMAHAKSEWIVELHYAFQDPRFLYMVMEFMPGGDLVNLMLNKTPSEEDAQFYVAELVLALDAVHSYGYVHRDVKPDNMLIAKDGHIKLADFGTCVKMDKDGLAKCSTAVGTPDYISPEVLKSQGSEAVYGREVDWWSVGIFLYEILYGEVPFYAETLMATYSRIMSYDRQLTFPDDVEISDVAKDLIRRFLSDSSVRLGRDGAAAVKAHPFFQNPNWTFETIREATPPEVPNLSSDDDTVNFDEVEVSATPDNIQIPKSFQGNQLQFIGFTYSNNFGPLAAIQKLIDAAGKSETNQNSALESELREAQRCLAEYASRKKQEDAEREARHQKLIQSAVKSEREKLEAELKEARRHLSQFIEQKEKEDAERMVRNQKLIDAAVKAEREALEMELKEAQHRLAQFADHKEQEDTERALRNQKLIEAAVKAERETLETELKEARRRLVQFADHEEQTLRNQKLIDEPAVKAERDALEAELKEAQRRLAQFADHKEQEDTDHAMRNLFRLELHAKNQEMLEKNRRIQKAEQMIEELREEHNRLINSFQKMQERHNAEKEDKLAIEEELRHAMNRHEVEIVTKDDTIHNLTQRETELTTTIKKLQEELSQIRKHSHGPIGLAPLSNANSSTSLVSSGTGSNEFDSLTREQLISKCKREIHMKDLTVQRLEKLAKEKGIGEEYHSRNNSRKKKNDDKRAQKYADFKVEQMAKEYKKTIDRLQNEVSYMREQLQEEHNARIAAENEAADLLSSIQPRQQNNADADPAKIRRRRRHLFNFFNE